MKNSRNFMLKVFCLLLTSSLFADNNVNSNSFLTIKGMDSNNHVELSGNTEWTFVNRKTNHVISVNGSNKGTKVKILKGLDTQQVNSDSIYSGEWLIAGLSEPYAGLSTAMITGEESQTVEVNMVIRSIDVFIDAPSEVVAGTKTKISWKLPKTVEGKFTLQKKGEEPLFYIAPRIFTKIYKDSTYDLKIPAIPGDYVLRFYSLKNTQKPLVERPLKVLPAKITLIAPEEAVAGTEIDISWIAPKTSEAKINLKYTRNKPDFNARYYVRTRNKESAKLLLPSGSGDYVLRWFNVFDREPMLEKLIKLTPLKVIVKAPDTAKADSTIDISWEAPERWEGQIIIVPAQASANEKEFKSISPISTKGKNSVPLKLPSEPGEYIIRVYNESDRVLIAENSIKLIKN
jgi:hypothetical protein